MRHFRSLLTLCVLLLATPVWASDISVPSSGSASVTEYFMRQAAQYALTNTASDQALFAAAQDTATMVSGVYRFECHVFIDGMSATSGNAIFKPVGAGTATTTTWAWQATGFDAASGGANTAVTAFHTTSASAASIMLATVNTRLFFFARGTFDMTVGGTMIPAIGLVTAIGTATNEVGSYCHFVRLGATGMTTIGAVN
jgi:hypothetical protein